MKYTTKNIMFMYYVTITVSTKIRTNNNNGRVEENKVELCIICIYNV